MSHSESQPVGHGARHRELDAARVVGRDRAGSVPPARRRRARRDTRCPGADDVAHLRCRRPGSRPARGQPLRERRVSRRAGRTCRSRSHAAHTSSRHASSRSCGYRRGRAIASFAVRGADRDQALHFDSMEERLVAGQSRDRQPIFLDLSFLDGRRGAHVNISGVSGVATKTTYASFLLYSLFHSGVLGRGGGEHEGAHLQRQGRGSALPRPRRTPA